METQKVKIEDKVKKARKSASELTPGDAILPGEILKDEIEARGISQVKLAEELGVSKAFVSDIIHGRRKISIETAVKLEQALDIPAKFWANLQAGYDIDILKIKLKEDQTKLSKIKR